MWTEYLLIGLMAAMLLVAWWAAGVLGAGMSQPPQSATLTKDEWTKILRVLRAIQLYHDGRCGAYDVDRAINQSLSFREVITKLEEQTQ